MGKKLVIKGADFSENCVILEKSFDELVPLVLGKGWGVSNLVFNRTQNQARASSDSTKFTKLQGGATVTITPKSGYTFVYLVADDIVEGMTLTQEQSNRWLTSSTTSEFVLDSTNGNSFIVQVRPTDTSVQELTGNSWYDYADIEITYE